MHVTRLQLQNYRNYHMLDLALPDGVTVIHGDNAQGKTNLLEAIYLLATGRSPRAGADRELVARCVPAGEYPIARAAATVQRVAGPLTVEVLIAAAGWSDAAAPGAAPAPARTGAAQKRVRINGAPRRLLDLIGNLPAVLFTPDDLDLVAGAPAGRRRFLDVMLSQLDPRYARVLSRYQRVLLQRNHLLKQIGEGQATVAELGVWDASLLDDGASIVQQRLSALDQLAPLAAACHARLTDGKEALSVGYQTADGIAAGADLAAVREALAAALRRLRPRELAQGLTLAGPHRDDLTLVVNGAPVGTFGSRGQQRTVSLALKLGEADLLRSDGREAPVLLLDDVLSELDPARRRALAETARGFSQVLITTAELDGFPASLLTDANLLTVQAGTVTPG
ncbi:MAG: DNA replication/repair protein RecF [Chloroflexi bacterium]|nr:DNA replication/repair protein RecF [Chloroflexota bacterium]